MAPRERVEAESVELACLILGGEEDDRLRHDEDGSVSILGRVIYPDGSGYKRTVEGRRKRLCGYVGDLLGDHGWIRVAWNRFRPPAPGG